MAFLKGNWTENIFRNLKTFQGLLWNFETKLFPLLDIGMNSFELILYRKQNMDS